MGSDRIVSANAVLDSTEFGVVCEHCPSGALPRQDEAVRLIRSYNVREASS